MSRVLKFTLPAPDIVDTVLDGRLPNGMWLEDLVRSLLRNWGGQRRVLWADAAER